MFIDASAMIAVLNEEPKASEVITALQNHSGGFYTSPTAVFEATLGVAKARLPKATRPTPQNIGDALAAVEKFLDTLQVEQAPVTAEIARTAIGVAATYGKAVGHPADLNFGDCFVYAMAKANHLPLLFIGRDFNETDIQSALANPSP